MNLPLFKLIFMKIIDLSVTISEEIKEPLPTKIVYEDHKEGAKKWEASCLKV
jgi:hypothetical protein